MRHALAALLLLVPGLAGADLSTKSPTSATGSGWTSPSNFADGNTGTAATYSVSALGSSTALIGASLGFDAAIPAGSTVSQVRSRIYWNSSSCTLGGVNAGWGLYVSGVLQGGSGSEACKTTSGWSGWYTSTGSWIRADLLDGTLTLRASGDNDHETTARTFSVFEGEVEVTYAPPGSRVHVGIWSVVVWSVTTRP